MKTIRRFIQWVRYVTTPTVYPQRWQDRLFAGHVNIGPITIYGANAMHWAVNVRAFGTFWCFHPTTRTFGGYWPWYVYVSPNATPWAATWIRRGKVPSRFVIDRRGYTRERAAA